MKLITNALFLFCIVIWSCPTFHQYVKVIQDQSIKSVFFYWNVEVNSERDNRKSIRKKKIAACFPALKSARKEEEFCQK